jgi:NAD(P)-dependent dehydrogenase (short-subunit alcohol dehydrogenase family)
MKHPDWTTEDIPSQSGVTFLVTGANSGIGWHTALELARKEARVILCARSEAKGREAIQRIVQEVSNANLALEVLDLASLSSIKSFAQKASQELVIDVLVNNAGVMSVPERRLTQDGFELQFGTNYLGPFALTGLLLPSLLKSSKPRVTTVSSGAANLGSRKIDFDNLNGEISYHPWRAYCQSKLADSMFSLELAKRAESVGIVSTAAHPGYALTNLQSSGPEKTPSRFERAVAKFFGQDAAMGALPILRAATASEALSGSYFGPDGFFQLKGSPVKIEPAAMAMELDARKKLWTVSTHLTGVDYGLPNDEKI